MKTFGERTVDSVNPSMEEYVLGAWLFNIACLRFPWEGVKEWSDLLKDVEERCRKVPLIPTWDYEGFLRGNFCEWTQADRLLPPSGEWVLVAISYGDFWTWAKANWQSNRKEWDIPYTGIADKGTVTHWRFIKSPYKKIRTNNQTI